MKPYCKKCYTFLKSARRQDLQGYQCPKCLAEAYPLRSLKKDVQQRISQQLKIHPQNLQNRGMPCGFCLKPMQKLMASQNVELDACRLCYMIWFGKNEFQELDQAAFAGGSNYSEELLKTHVADVPRRIEREPNVDYLRNIKGAPANDILTPPETVLSFLGLPLAGNQVQLKRSSGVAFGIILFTVLTSVIAFKKPELQESLMILNSKTGLRQFQSLFTHFLVHSGWLHLFGNMYFLYLLGDMVEDFLGFSNYILLLALSTFIGGLTYVVLFPQGNALGASGGVFGVMTFYMLTYPYHRFLYSLRSRALRLPVFTFAVPVWLLLIFSIAGQIIQASSGVPNGSVAHLGGAAVGLVFHMLYPQRVPE